jgi:leucyl aminopeptidase (aminopeptidase T)
MSTLKKAARVALEDLVGVEAGEEVLINTNPDDKVYPIALELFRAANDLKAKPTIMVQNTTTILDYAERLVIEAIKAEPDVFLSITADEFGQDPYGLHVGYVARDGNKYDTVYDKATAGDRRTRGFQACGVTVEMFERLVPVDYGPMKALSSKLKEAIDGHNEIRVTSPAGTDITFSIEGRQAVENDGDCRSPGAFGNLPAGEVYISPVIGSANGIIAFDGSLKLVHRAVQPKQPIMVTFSDGFVSDISGGEESELLKDTILQGDQMARSFGNVDAEKFNGNLGEFGIGTNEHARITGYVLEDEKVLKTAHFAIGDNYDFDANGILHQDGLIMRPTVLVDGRMIMKDGDILL